MTKKTIMIFTVFTVLFSLLIPVAAQAYPIPTGSVAYDVAKENNLLSKHNVIFEVDGNYYLYAYGGNVSLGYNDNTLHGKSAGGDFNWWAYKYNPKNVYEKPTRINIGYYLSGKAFDSRKVDSILYTDTAIYEMNEDSANITDTVAFAPGSHKSTTGSNTEHVSSNKLSAIINGSMLSPVLSEVVAVLPIVLPVVIVFISIRKGLAFVLASLRSA